MSNWPFALPSSDSESVASQARGLLMHLSNDELKQLLNDDSNKRIDDLVKDNPQVKALEAERDMLITSNKSLAEFNLSREPAYRQARQMLSDAYNETKDLKESVDKKKSKLGELERQTSLDTTLALMQTAHAEAEEESENLATAFLSGDINLDSFLIDYINQRKTTHLRRIKTEKLMDVVRNGTQRNSFEPSRNFSSNFQPMRPAPPPPQPSYLPRSTPFAMSSNPNSVPYSAPYPIYPMQPSGMPQPPLPFSRPPTYR